MVAVFMHCGLNQQCEPAQFIASFPTFDPGTVSTSASFLPVAALRATLGLSNDTIEAIVNQVNSVAQVNPCKTRSASKRATPPSLSSHGKIVSPES